MYSFLKEDKLKPSVKKCLCDNLTTGSATVSDLCNSDTQNKTTETKKKSAKRTGKARYKEVS